MGMLSFLNLLGKGPDRGEQPSSLDLLKKEVVRKNEAVKEQPKSDSDLELRVIKSLNDIEALKKKIEEATAAILVEIKRVNSNVDNLSDAVKGIPRQTMSELKDARGNQPLVYDKIKDVINQSIKASVLDTIDTSILNLIKEAGRLNSRHLLEKAEAQQVCSKNTLFIHLKRLEDRGLIMKKRAGHEVMYSLNVIEQPKQEAPQPEPKPIPA